MSGPRRIERLLFVGLLVSYAYFQPGGGWNQNARFAQIRAIVEEGRLSIDSFLVYELVPGPDGTPTLARSHVGRGVVSTGGVSKRLGWPDGAGGIVPVDPTADASLPLAPLVQVAATGDVSYSHGSFYPNKAPGTTLLAVPAYALVFGVERALGIDPDRPRILTVNAWLASASSIGLLAALGGVLFFRAALLLSSGRLPASLLATLAFGLATMYFPYATMLFEHAPTAIFLLLSFYLALRAAPPWTAGASAGLAILSNYTTAPAAVILLLYLAAKRKGLRTPLTFAAGALGPLLLLSLYHLACFGSPLTTAYAGETPAFQAAGGAFLSLFNWPSPAVATALLVSPFRGLFVSSPILVAGLCALVAMLRRREHRAEALVCASMFAYFLVVNASFNGWHGGAAAVPRYLAGAVPFLALPLVFAFDAMPRMSGVLGALSAAAMLLLTAVDPQCPVGALPFAAVEGKPLWRHDPWTSYEIPLAATGRAGPLMRDLREHEQSDEMLATIEGPVSVNPIGMYEGWLYTKFPPGAPEVSGNSFNAGELLAPRRLSSLLPLGLVWGAVLLGLRRERSSS